MPLFVPAQLPGVCQVLFRLRGQPMGAVANPQMEALAPGARYSIERVVACNASGTLAAAVGVIRSAVGGGGNIIVTPSFAGLTTPAHGSAIGATSEGIGLRSGPLWFNLTTPSAAPQTVDIYLIGYVL